MWGVHSLVWDTAFHLTLVVVEHLPQLYKHICSMWVSFNNIVFCSFFFGHFPLLFVDQNIMDVFRKNRICFFKATSEEEIHTMKEKTGFSEKKLQFPETRSEWLHYKSRKERIVDCLIHCIVSTRLRTFWDVWQCKCKWVFCVDVAEKNYHFPTSRTIFSGTCRFPFACLSPASGKRTIPAKCLQKQGNTFNNFRKRNRNKNVMNTVVSFGMWGQKSRSLFITAHLLLINGNNLFLSSSCLLSTPFIL